MPSFDAASMFDVSGGDELDQMKKEYDDAAAKKVWDLWVKLDETAKQIFLDFIFVVTGRDGNRLVVDPEYAMEWKAEEARMEKQKARLSQGISLTTSDDEAKGVWDHYIKLNEDAKQMFLDNIFLVTKADGDRIVVDSDYAQAAAGASWMSALAGGGRHKKHRRRKSKRRKSKRRKSTRRKTKKRKSKRRKSRRRRR